MPRSNWFPCRKCSSNHLEVLSIWTRKLFSHLCGLFYLLAASVIQRGRSVGLEKITLCAPCNLLITVFRSSSSIGWSMQLNGRDSLCISLYTIFQKISGIFDLNFYSKVSKNRSKWKTSFHMICKEGQLDVVNQIVNDKIKAFGINLNAQHVNGLTHFDSFFLNFFVVDRIKVFESGLKLMIVTSIFFRQIILWEAALYKVTLGWSNDRQHWFPTANLALINHHKWSRIASNWRSSWLHNHISKLPRLLYTIGLCLLRSNYTKAPAIQSPTFSLCNSE